MSELILTTTKRVVRVLGGTNAVAALTRRQYSAAHNWLGFKSFPAKTYVVMKAALRERGYDAPDSLWGMDQ